MGMRVISGPRRLEAGPWQGPAGDRLGTAAVPAPPTGLPPCSSSASSETALLEAVGGSGDTRRHRGSFLAFVSVASRHARLDGDVHGKLTMTAREHTEGEFGNREGEADECPPAKRRSPMPPRELLEQTCNIQSPQRLTPHPDDSETLSHRRTFWPKHSLKLSSRGTLWKHLVTQHVLCVTVYLDLTRCAFHVQKQFIDTNAPADPEGCLLWDQAHLDLTLSPC
ncbi:uncharacterized protein LOC123815609 [Phyllostomus hastatus]|uniref:uncharacterized protein LOC123815609 n=1 Tax=Phyllostomus hastatus TaxID=9423 RepID=UPI001E67F263|nr:uncharacterized protein LOC123815609 [Phyllostomus hastatus]